MQSTRLARLTIAAALAAAPLALSAALAATPAEVHPGMQVIDPAGGSVGVVTGVNGANLILKTDKHEVTLPMTSFTANNGKLLFAMTAAQLNAETEQAMAAANAAMTVGTQVYGSDGTLAGQIDAMDDSFVTIKIASGALVRVPRSGIVGTPKGAMVGMTTAQLNQVSAEATPTAHPDSTASESASDGK
jgi:preprotein translocase subunit YajC